MTAINKQTRGRTRAKAKSKANPKAPMQAISEARAPVQAQTQTQTQTQTGTQIQAQPGTRVPKRGVRGWRAIFIEAFLQALRQRPFVGEAVEAGCVAAARRIRRRTVEEWREEDEPFRSAWDEALEAAWDRAECAAYTRAVDGVAKPIIDRKTGDTIGHTYEYSDRLLEVLLKSNRAKVYADSRHKTDAAPAPATSVSLAGVLREIRMRRQRSLGGLPGASEAISGDCVSDVDPAPASPYHSDQS